MDQEIRKASELDFPHNGAFPGKQLAGGIYSSLGKIPISGAISASS